MDLRKQINLLLEDRKHEFGCAMLYFDFDQMEYIHSLIDKNDLYIDDEDSSFGLETEPHCTLLFGLHEEVDTQDIADILNQYSFTTLKIYNPSFFEKEDLYDVLKFDVFDYDLRDINKELCKFPHTNDYPNYHPHCTIAYLQPGLGQKYVDILNRKKLNQFQIPPSYAVYSKANGGKDEIYINVE